MTTRTSSRPRPRTRLGAGLAWALALGLISAALIYVFKRPVADVLLGDPEDENLVAIAGLLAGAMLVFKICDITLWLERRSGAYLIADTSRPLLGLIALTAFLAAGSGVEGAMIGTLIGTAIAGIVGLILLAGSFETNFDLAEIKQIILRGRYRAPIVMSFWLVQNADIFILSRFVDHTELGVYSLASRLGFVVSFLPQGFRMGMRPLRKSAMWDAFQEQYGKRTAGGQLLAYFILVCILAVLTMVLGGQVLVDIAPASYAEAASLIPFTAFAFVMPALYRTVNQNVAAAEQAAAVHRRRDRRGADLHRRHLGAGGADRRLRGADRDDRRLRRPGALPLHPRPARQEAALLPLPRGRAPRSCSRS